MLRLINIFVTIFGKLISEENKKNRETSSQLLSEPSETFSKKHDWVYN